MNLKVEWINATRIGEEKRNVEAAYETRLLELFGSVAAAAEAKGHWHSAYEPPIHNWTKFNNIAQVESTCNLPPSERRMCCFVVKFEQ